MRRAVTITFALALGVVLGAGVVGGLVVYLTPSDVQLAPECPVPVIRHRPGPLTAPRA